MYNRELKTKLLELSQTWSIISVTGPRQSGKTTLCKMAFPEYEYVNLERATTRALVEQDIEGFLLHADFSVTVLRIDSCKYVIPTMFLRCSYTNTPIINRICTVYQPYIYRS